MGNMTVWTDPVVSLWDMRWELKSCVIFSLL
uniref:Uncharacterized protein n=1 Tax=Rhizophora mucronata TaxID=61149 RepID=A0A2P2IP18_RHIMU